MCQRTKWHITCDAVVSFCRPNLFIFIFKLHEIRVASFQWKGSSNRSSALLICVRVFRVNQPSAFLAEWPRSYRVTVLTRVLDMDTVSHKVDSCTSRLDSNSWTYDRQSSAPPTELPGYIIGKVGTFSKVISAD